MIVLSVYVTLDLSPRPVFVVFLRFQKVIESAFAITRRRCYFLETSR